jgi:hypothetical protein
LQYPTLAGAAVVVIAAVTDFMAWLFFSPNAESVAKLAQVGPWTDVTGPALLVKGVSAASTKTEALKLNNVLACVIGFLPEISRLFYRQTTLTCLSGRGFFVL